MSMTSAVRLEWKDIQDFYPTPRLQEYLEKRYSQGIEVQSLDFSGIQQVTDEVLQVLASEASRHNRCGSLQSATFAGCIHLTDYGVYTLAKSFTNLIKVDLDGCSKVTEQGLQYLISKCPALQDVSLRGCDIGIVPQVKPEVSLHLEGCPVCCDLGKEQTVDQGDKSVIHKAVIMCDQNLKVDIASYLRGTQGGEVVELAGEQTNMKFSPEMMTYEFHGNQLDPAAFITDGALYIFAYDVDHLENPQVEIMARWENVRGQILCAPFIVLAFHRGETSQEHIESAVKTLRSALEFRQERTKQQIQRDKVDGRERDFQFQQQYSRSLQALEFHQNDPVYFFSVDMETKLVMNYPLKGDTGQGSNAEKEFMRLYQEFQDNYGNEAKMAIQSLNKSDISEVVSFASPPSAVMLVAKALLVLNGKEPSLEEASWKSFKMYMRKNMSFLMNACDSISDMITFDENYGENCGKIREVMENPDLNSQTLRNVSRAMSAMYIWINAIYVFHMKYSGPLAVLKSSVEEFRKIQECKDHTAIANSLKSCSDYISQFYEWQPNALTQSLHALSTSLPDVKVMLLKDYVENLNEKPFGSDIRKYRKALKRLMNMGVLLFYPEVPGEPIIFNIQWFMDLLSIQYREERFRNIDRVLSLNRYSHLFTRDELQELYETNCTEKEFSAILSIQQHFGMVFEVQSLVTRQETPCPYFVFYKDVPPKIYLWSNPRKPNPENMIGNVQDMENYGDTEGLISGYYYVKHFWPDQKPEPDLEIKVSYSLDLGMPAALVPQIFARMYEVFDVQFCCQWSIVIRLGAVEARVKYNVHGTMITGSLDVEARCTKFITEQQPTETVIHQYMWSVVNRVCLIIEAAIYAYPNLQSRVSFPCLGSCANSVSNYSFSPLELKRDVTHQIVCPSCKEESMSSLSFGLLTGRQATLPFHDWVDHVGQIECHHCGISEELAGKLWDMESFLYPSFLSQTFEVISSKLHVPNDCAEPGDQGDVDAPETKKTGPSIYLSKFPLDLKQLKKIQIFILDPDLVKIHILPDRECMKRIREGTLDNFQESLRQSSDFVLDLTSGINLMKNNGEGADKEEVEDLKVSSGDVLDFVVESGSAEEPECDNLFLKISKNGTRVTALNIPVNSFLAICTDPKSIRRQSPNIAVSTPGCPVVSARHFSVNTALVYKTGLGMQWAVGNVQSIQDGYLFISPGKEDQDSTVRIHPQSDDIRPLCIHPGDMSVIIGKEAVKNVEQFYQFLDDHQIIPAPMGLFRSVTYDKTDFRPLPLKGRSDQHPVLCTASIYSPTVLSRTAEMAATKKSQGPEIPAVFLPFDLEPYYLYHPARLVVQDLAHQAISAVCVGDTITYYSKNVHFNISHLLNEATIPIENSGENSTKVKEVLHVQENLAPSLLDRYLSLLTYPQTLTQWNHIFPHVKEDFDKNLMRRCLEQLLSLYVDTLVLLMATRSKTQSIIPYSNKEEVEKFSEKIQSSIRAAGCLENNLCQSHNAVDWKLAGENDIRVIKLAAKTQNATKMFQLFKNLVSIDVSGCSLSSLENIDLCKRLEYLKISDNNFTELPPEVSSLAKTLKYLAVDTNPLRELPQFIVDFLKLESLDLANTLVTSLPEDFGCLVKLQWLSLASTAVVMLPKSFRKLKYLRHLNLQGVKWLTMIADNPASRLPLNKFLSLMSNRSWSYSMSILNKQVLEDLYHKCEQRDGVFTAQGVHDLQEGMFKLFPRLGVETDPTDTAVLGGVPPEIFSCRNLTYLNLSYQGLKFIPDLIRTLKHLQQFIISDNPNLTSISGEVGKTAVEGLPLHNCPSLKTPPQEIIRQNDPKLTIAYLRRLAAGSVTCYRTKLMLVGLGEAGKTSLMRALMSEDSKASDTREGITDGIDIQNWPVTKMNQTITYSAWDFAGQTVYYNTHQFFLSKRAIYLLVWNMRLGFEHAGIEFWLNSIQCHAPDTPVFIVGTHLDKVPRSDVPSSEILRKFSNVVGFFNVSSFTGEGVPELLEKLVQTTFEQPYIGERIPEAWFNFEKNILSRRHNVKKEKKDLLSWQEIEEEATKSAVFGQEVKQAVQFLHDLGSLQHFDNDFLRDRVVINPQWIVNVMACVVSVHNNVNRDGRLAHKDIGVIWEEYDTELHDWLLRLTELFDLTFPLADQDVNIIPCLLPQKEPEIEWPPMKEDTRRSEMLYKFDSLPAGLFNRAQVRLYQYSDFSTMWKRGSVLRKNEHMAVVTMESDHEIIVKAQGSRPENMILLVHEVFEGLIHEFFQGVKYEYLMPCPDCLKADVKSPTMFSSSVLRRCVEMKALHLQCHAYFHSLAISEIQALMPPEASDDYEIHMNNMVHDLTDLQSQLPYDACLIYCTSDVPVKEGDGVHPRQVKEDLEKRGLICWYDDNLRSLPVDDVMKAMTSSKTIITFVSDNFVLDPVCQRMFQFGQESLRRSTILVMTGKGREWQKSIIGMRTAHQVYINMQRVGQYEKKLEELTSQITAKVGRKKVTKACDIFLSYCWTNSAKAVTIGHAMEKPGSLGHGDPRYIKEYLEKQGFSAWIDFENVGVNGLFSDIADSLKKCKIVVACVSDEYAMSPNCQMEFRFAHVTLKKPIILAVVGTGYRWESTEVGLLSLGYPKINFQVANNLAFSQLKELIGETLSSLDKKAEMDQSVPQSGKQSAFQELYELAQRKFLRQLIGYTDNGSGYPRLFVIDINQGERSENEIDVETSPEHHPDRYCFRVLCEHEGGWHVVEEGFPITLPKDKSSVELLKLTAPFFARIMSILKHSNINLNCLSSPLGFHLMETLEKHAGVNVDMLPFYTAIRNHIIRKDVRPTYGGLARCYLPSGKFLWLCPEHQNLPRISKLEMLVPSTGAREPDDSSLVEELRVYGDLKVKTQAAENVQTGTDVQQNGENLGIPTPPPQPDDELKQRPPAPPPGSPEDIPVRAPAVGPAPTVGTAVGTVPSAVGSATPLVGPAHTCTVGPAAPAAALSTSEKGTAGKNIPDPPPPEKPARAKSAACLVQ